MIRQRPDRDGLQVQVCAGRDPTGTFYAWLRTGGGKHGRPLSASIVREVHAVLSGALKQAVVWSWIGHNPAKLATPPAIQKADVRPPQAEDATRLLAAAMAEDRELGLFLRLAVVLGARRGELCGAITDALAIRLENRVGPILAAHARHEPRSNLGTTSPLSETWTNSSRAALCLTVLLGPGTAPWAVGAASSASHAPLRRN